MQYIIGVAGLALVFGMAFIVSNDRKKIKYRPILTMLVLQFVLGFLLLNTVPAGDFSKISGSRNMKSYIYICSLVPQY